jgi:8-amino-7-oxononanoate synthase
MQSAYLAETYSILGKRDSALYFIESAEKYTGRAIWSIPYVTLHIGKVYANFGNQREALHYLQEARISSSPTEAYWEFEATKEIVRVYNASHDLDSALFYAQTALSLAERNRFHASIIDGCRLSYASRFRFAHNDLEDLEDKLRRSKGNIFVAVESVYSMDGDMAPLNELAAVCKKYNANLVVDEAHATGVFGKQGRGLVNQHDLEKEVFARVHTFGKAIGCHGAVILGSDTLRNYLVNFARSFIFTTALPVHSLVTIKCAYEQLMADGFNNTYLHQLIEQFKLNFRSHDDTYLIESCSPIQSLVIPGNERVKHVSRQLQAKGFDVRAIVSPSVPAGKERLRISLHAHNTVEQVDRLKLLLNEILCG